MTTISQGHLEVFSPTGKFLFSAFLHAGRYFLDSHHYYVPTIQRNETTMIFKRDASYDNLAEFWHQMGHVNCPGLKYFSVSDDRYGCSTETHTLFLCMLCND